ncbi:MAG: Uma2 family endonuclease [Acidobacteriota bacterium]
MASQFAVSETETLVRGDELLAMGDIGRCELVDGRLVRMSPTGYAHGCFEMNFGERIRSFVKQHDLGRVVVGEVGIFTARNPDSVRGADVAYISHDRLSRRRSPHGFLDVAPELIVEIMSPDDRWSEVMKKLDEYFRIGVLVIWVADPASRTVYAYRSITRVSAFGPADVLAADEVLPGFAVPVADLFQE